MKRIILMISKFSRLFIKSLPVRIGWHKYLYNEESKYRFRSSASVCMLC